MTIDKSLKSKNKLLRRRNVLTREERMERLVKEERWSEGDSVFGLPKVKVEIVTPRRPSPKPKKAEEPQPAAEGPAEPEEGEQ